MTIATEPTTERSEPKQIVAQPEETRTEKQISLYYGERSEIRELVSRIKAGLPNASKIPDAGVLALATSAYAHDLDPWNGEIWVIYNDKKNETSLMAGVKGLRKAAKKQLAERQHYYLSFRPILPEEYHLYALDSNDEWGHPVELAEICELRRGDACAEYSKTLRQLFDMCGSFEEAREMLGPMPVYIGIGVVRKGEKSKMEKCHLVKKRAESDALKRAFDLPFADRVNGNGSSVTVGNSEEDVVEGDYQVTDPKDELRDFVRNNPVPEYPAKDEAEPALQPQAEEKPESPAVVEEEGPIGEESIAPAPEPQPEPPAAEKPVVKAQAAAPAAEKKIPVEPKAKPAPKKAEEKPAPIKDTGGDAGILALKRSKPDTWLIAAEWLNKQLKTNFTAGKLREAVDEKLGSMFTELSVDAWMVAIEIALDASSKK